MSAVVSVFAASSIQSYVFRSNKLKENVGASALVEWALGEVLRLHAGHQGGEQVYAAGGKAVWVFPEEAKAREATFTWSRSLLESSPGLRVSAAHRAFDPGALAEAHEEAFSILERVQESPSVVSPLLALPIVRTCSTTGLPATRSLGTGEYVSSESARKREAAESAHSLFEEKFAEALGNDIFPVVMEGLGGIQGDSRIAVVHADGNDMGARLKAISMESTQDVEFKERMKAFTESVRSAGEGAFRSVLVALRTAQPGLQKRKILGVLEGVFPIRPLVIGGDDLTFLCDGRLGLSLATLYLRNLATFELEDKKPMDACAGVAIVGKGFPFARAYALAEELCASAKRGRREAKERNPDVCGSWIDFQVVRSGAGGSLTASRARGMADLQGGPIHRRPWPLRHDARPDWAWFEKASEVFAAWPRSRAKALLAAFESGPEAAAHDLADAASRGVFAPGGGAAGAPTEAYLFDPLDAMDVAVTV